MTALALAASIAAAIGFGALTIRGARTFTETRDFGVLVITVLAGSAALGSLVVLGFVLAGRLP